MKTNFAGFTFGGAFGCLLAWAHLADADVIRDMLMLREADVFLLMGSAVAVAAIGSWILRAMKVRAPLSARPSVGTAFTRGRAISRAASYSASAGVSPEHARGRPR
jgi:hypothetical protein